jgi:hypothetical protein
MGVTPPENMSAKGNATIVEARSPAAQGKAPFSRRKSKA